MSFPSTSSFPASQKGDWPLLNNNNLLTTKYALHIQRFHSKGEEGVIYKHSLSLLLGSLFSRLLGRCLRLLQFLLDSVQHLLVMEERSYSIDL